MARDDDFRKVAEEIRALARSLGKDFRDSVDQARRGGQPTGQAFRHGLRDVADQARSGFRSGWGPAGSPHRRGYYQGGYGSWGRGPWGRGPWGHGWAHPSPPPGVPGSPAGTPDGGVTPGGPPPGGATPFERLNQHRARTSRPPVRHRWDATTVLGLLAVLFGVAWLLGATQVLHVSIEAVLAIGLMLLGASLIVTARTDWSLSRRSWPVLAGVGLIAVLVATSSTFGVGGALQDVSFGTMTATAHSGATIHGGFGTLTVDASQLHPGPPVQVDSVAGTITIQSFPPGVPVEINAHVLAGQICGGGYASNGVGAQRSVEVGGSGPPAVTINVHEVFGQIKIANSSCNSSGRHP